MQPAQRPLVLALDTSSPVLSVALGAGGSLLAQASAVSPYSARQLMQMIAGVLKDSSAAPRDLGGVIALAGPGSFTGIRIGLATAYGFHHALGIPALALSTLEALAASIGESSEAVVAAVDAQRGEWAVQVFERDGRELRARAPLELLPAAQLWAESSPLPRSAVRVGFGLPSADGSVTDPRKRDAGPLAPTALRLGAQRDRALWDVASLTAPIYSRPPAATLPARRQG